MAQENILSISLKDYKKQIDDLKASLLGLEKGSVEYNKTVEEINKRQTKLNEVLEDTKKTTTVASNTMAELKKNLKDMLTELNNTEIGTKRFNELQESILKTNNKLKDLEAAHGTFSRNVGNYTQGVLDAFDKMGVSTKGLQGAFNIATNAGQGFNSMLNVLKAHPIITVLTILSTIIYKIYDSIGNSEKATNKWNVAMSNFKPIMDIFNNIMEKLALVLIDVVDWIGTKMPSAIKYTQKICGGFVDALGGIVKGFYYVKDGASVMATTINTVVAKALQSVADKFADFISYIPGLDSMANKLKNFSTNILKTTEAARKSAMSTLQQNLRDVDNWTQRAKVSVNDFFDDWNNRTTQHRQLAELEFGNELNAFTSMEERKREQELLTTEYERKENELRDKIAKASGAEKIRLAKELNKVISEDYKQRIALAKQEYEVQKQLDDLAPNSIKDNEKLYELKKNITKLEAEAIGSQIKGNKIITSTQASIAKNDEQRQKSEISLLKAVNAEHFNNFNTYMKLSDIELQKSLANIDKNLKEQLEALNKEELTETQLREKRNKIYTDAENERYNILIQYYNTNKEYAEKQLEEDLARNKYSNQEQSKYYVELQKIKLQLDDEEIAHKEELKNLSITIAKDTYKEYIDNAKKYQGDFIKTVDSISEILSGLDRKTAVNIVDMLGLSETESTAIIQKFDIMWQDLEEGSANYYKLLEENQHGYNLSVITAEEELYNQLKELKGPADEEVLNLQKELNAHKEQEEYRHVNAMAEAYRKDADNAKKNLQQKKKDWLASAKAMGNIFGIVGDIIQEDIDNQVESGKISEQEAKRRFEQVKTFQIAAAIVNSIASGVEAYESTWGDPSIPTSTAKAVLGALNMATAVATGYAQVQAIKNTNYGSTSGSSSAGTSVGVADRGITSIDFSGVRVNPLLDQQADINRLDAYRLQQPEEQRVVILQSDIAESQKQVEIRQQNTTF